MKRRRKTERILAIVLSVCVMVTMCPFIADSWNGSGHVDAAKVYTADQLVNEATSKAYLGRGYFKVRKAMKKNGHSPLSYGAYTDDTGDDWCAWYIAATARNAGLKKIIPAKGMRVDYFVKGIIAAGGKLTFVNSAYRDTHKKEYKGYSYKKNYKPRKGDIVMFGSSSTFFSHVGIVTANASSPSSANTVEGNTDNNYWKYRRSTTP